MEKLSGAGTSCPMKENLSNLLQYSGLSGKSPIFFSRVRMEARESLGEGSRGLEPAHVNLLRALVYHRELSRLALESVTFMSILPLLNHDVAETFRNFRR